MQIVNDVARRGFVVGWDPLRLGNALSCVATLFLLSRRTGVASVFPYVDRYAELFARPDSLSWIYVPRSTDREKLQSMIERLKPVLDVVPEGTRIGGSSFQELGIARVKGVVWFSRHEARLIDWREGDAENHLRRFCRRGNGLVLQGAYWRQYTDMRELAREGEALRRHLGPLRTDRFAAHDEPSAVGLVKIGLHLRLGDYRIWMDGRYFFDVEDYRHIAERIHRELGSRPHIFHVFSDQDLDPTAFGDLPASFAPADQFTDFISLSRCDVVVGPPSTFSTWAAFIGRSKRLVLTKERVADTNSSLLPLALDVPYPTGSYLPGDAQGRPI